MVLQRFTGQSHVSSIALIDLYGQENRALLRGQLSRMASPSAKAATTASTVETFWIDIDLASFSVKPVLVESLVESLVCTGRQLVGPGDGALRALTV